LPHVQWELSQDAVHLPQLALKMPQGGLKMPQGAVLGCPASHGEAFESLSVAFVLLACILVLQPWIFAPEVEMLAEIHALLAFTLGIFWSLTSSFTSLNSPSLNLP
jgi:hypothetical protein